MSLKKPRLQVDPLGEAPRIQPQADPNSVGAYVAPRQSEVLRPTGQNAWEKLADSLHKLDPEIRKSVQQGVEMYTAEQEAQLVSDFKANRDKWNTAVRSGQVPLGASPHAARAVHRLMLSELADDFQNRATLEFQTGPGGASARSSNNPETVRQFLDSQSQAFRAAHLRDGERDLFSSLDVQDVFDSKQEQFASKLMQHHAQFRVQEVEREITETVSAATSNTIDATFASLSEATPDEIRRAKLREAGDTISDKLYNIDHGAVRNGLPMQKGGDLIVDSIVARAIARQDRSVLELIDHIKRPDGPPLSLVPAHQERIRKAEEHITNLSIQEEAHQWAQEQRPYQREALHRQEGEWQKADQRWAQEVESWNDKTVNKVEGEILRSLTRRVYEGLNTSNSRKGVSIINDAIRQAEVSLPERAESLRGLVAAAHSRKVHVEDNPQVVASIYLQMGKDPLSFDENTLAREVKNGNITVSTMRGIFDDLDRKRTQADHPLVRQPEFKEMLSQVQRGALTSPDDEYSAEGALRLANASSAFRDKAASWIERHPKGGMAEFREYMRDQIEPTIERANRDYGLTKEAKRDEAETEKQRGEMVVKRTTEALKAREAQEAQAKKAEKERLDGLKDFKPSGKKTNEGRPILQNSKGDIMTERTITIQGIPEINGGGITNIPTVFNGRVVSDDEAVEIMKQNKGVDPETGKKMRRYWSITDAVIAARERSNRLGSK